MPPATDEPRVPKIAAMDLIEPAPLPQHYDASILAKVERGSFVS